MSAIRVEPLTAPPDATVVVPGSKSLTNRALLCAGLARGATSLVGALDADDTRAMAGCLTALGVRVETAAGGWVVVGVGGPAAWADAELDCALSGTTARFLLPTLAVGAGTYRLDGGAPLRRRPMGGLLDAVRSLGASITEEGEAGHLPLTVRGTPLEGGLVRVPGAVTSQFLSALLLAAPFYRRGLELDVDGDIVSAPYVAMTLDVLRDFGAAHRGLQVAPGPLVSPGAYEIEPDASAASYFFAVAALTGGRVTVEGLGPGSRQGDLRFADHVLSLMGASVDQDAHHTTVTGPAPGGLRGVDVDLRELPDMAQTVAVVATGATGPTRVRGVGFIRGHETDRIEAVVTELRRCGIEAHPHDDGFTVVPGPVHPAEIQTYEDHRMAMSFALLGLLHEGITIADPDCTAKTFPGYFDALGQLR